MDRFELVLIRLRAGVKQYELAQLLGIPATIICDLERGRRTISPEVEKSIMEAISKAKDRNFTVSGRG